MIEEIEFVPEPWLYVHATSDEAARRFFGAPPRWPVEWVRPSDRFRGQQVWRVKAEGLIVS